MRLCDGSYHSPFLVGLEGLSQLADLALTLDLCIYTRWDDEYYLLRVKRMAESTFGAISGTSELRRFALEGDWAMSEASLVRFVGEHTASLRCLILYGSTLDGDWISALRAIADVTRGKLEYISVLHDRVVVGHGAPSNFHLDEYEGEVPQFDCETDFRRPVRVDEAENEEHR
jgi:hypothetical protein